MAGVAPQKSGPVPQELELPGGKSGFRNWLDRDAWRDIIITTPYIWLLLFFVVPVLHHCCHEPGSIGHCPTAFPLF